MSDFPDVHVPAYHLREPGDYETYPTDFKTTTTFLITDLHVLGLLCCGRRHKGRFIVFAPYDILVSIGADVLDADQSESGLVRKGFELVDVAAECETKFGSMPSLVPRSSVLIQDRREKPKYVRQSLWFTMLHHREEREAAKQKDNSTEVLRALAAGESVGKLCSKKIAALLRGWSETCSGKRVLEAFALVSSGKEEDEACQETLCDPRSLHVFVSNCLKKGKRK